MRSTSLERVAVLVDAVCPTTPARRDRSADVLLQQERLCETLGLRARGSRIIERD